MSIPNNKDILEAIKAYGEAYKRLEELQPPPKPRTKVKKDEWAEIEEGLNNRILIPRGDQKSGCIGEFYASQYLQENGYKVNFGGHSQKGWDIEAEKNGIKEKFQVKTITRYSKTNRIGKLKKGDGWDKLILVFLDYDFTPKGFYEANPKGYKSFREYPSPPKGKSNQLFGRQLTCRFWDNLSLEAPSGLDIGNNLIEDSKVLKRYSQKTNCEELEWEWWK